MIRKNIDDLMNMEWTLFSLEVRSPYLIDVESIYKLARETEGGIYFKVESNCLRDTLYVYYRMSKKTQGTFDNAGGSVSVVLENGDWIVVDDKNPVKITRFINGGEESINYPIYKKADAPPAKDEVEKK